MKETKEIYSEFPSPGPWTCGPSDSFIGDVTSIYDADGRRLGLFLRKEDAEQAVRNAATLPGGWQPIDQHDGTYRPVEVYRDGEHWFASWSDADEYGPACWDADLEYGGKPIEPPPTHFREIVGPHGATKDRADTVNDTQRLDRLRYESWDFQ